MCEARLREPRLHSFGPEATGPEHSRAMKRHARRLLVGLSLLGCVGCLILWARSYSTMDSLDWYRHPKPPVRTYDDLRGLFSQYGSIGFGYVRVDHPGPPEFPSGWRYSSNPPLGVGWPRRFRFLGFGTWRLEYPANPGMGTMHVSGLELPHWLLAMLLATAPAMAARRMWLARRRRRRLKTGLCAECGYDVRASADRCPECGFVVLSPCTQGKG